MVGRARTKTSSEWIRPIPAENATGTSTVLVKGTSTVQLGAERGTLYHTWYKLYLRGGDVDDSELIVDGLAVGDLGTRNQKIRNMREYSRPNF